MTLVARARSKETRSRALWLGLTAVAVLAGVTAGVALIRREAPPVAVDRLIETARPLVIGQVANFILSATPEPAPDVTFVDGAGVTHHLAGFPGRLVVANLAGTLA